MMKNIYVQLLLVLSFVCTGNVAAKINLTETQHIGDFYYYGEGYVESYSPNDYRFPLKVTFRLDKKMGVTISHCGSSGYLGTSMRLTGPNVSMDVNTACSFNRALKETTLVLEPGLYTVTSEGTTIEDDPCLDVSVETFRPEASINGNTTPINIGVLNVEDIKQYENNSYDYTNSYTGTGNTPAGDIYYRFSLTQSAKIIVSNIADSPINTYLLNSSKSLIKQATGTNLTERLNPGTYYIVVESSTERDGLIKTIVEAMDVNAVIYDNASKIIFPSGSSGKNYISTATMLKPTAEQRDINLTSDNSILKFDYFDELGRQSETVMKGYTHNQADLVTFTEYDSHGRLDKEWSAAAISGNNGQFVDKNAIISNHTDSKPYALTMYEDSPLNRVAKQIGPGTTWHNAGKGVATGYELNVSGDLIKHYKVDNQYNLTLYGYYGAGTLYSTKTTDEDGNTSYQYADKMGRTILERQINNENHDTYHVYDGHGKLCYVLPPMFTVITSDELNKYAYSYKYDDRNRCIEKKIPGTEVIKYYYDKADRLIFSQDGEQRNKGEYSFRLYDAFGREVITGTSYNMNMPNMDELTVKATYVGNSGWERTGYAINSSLNFGLVNILTVNYYDTYGFLDLEIANGLQGILGYDSSKAEFNTKYNYIPNNVDLSAKGLLTGSFVSVLDGFTGIMTVNYYDEKGRIIQTRGLNHMAALEFNYYKYTFSGKTLKHQHEHYGVDNVSELYTYNYDHAERLTSTTHQLNGGPIVTLSTNSYNELGLLGAKSNHGGLNPTTYTYNIRNWVTSMQSENFTQNLSYAPYYNGNISKIKWKTKKDFLSRHYTFTYDALNRIKRAMYGEGEQSQPNFRYTTEIGSYDKHGNIKNILRWGLVDDLTFVPGEPILGMFFDVVDDLTLSYNGNQLINVGDDSPNDPIYHGVMHFVDGVDESQEYIYDRNGNMTVDKNKGIKRITYNHLNLPETINLKNTSSPDGSWFPDNSVIDENDEIEYLIDNEYDASGTKLTASYYKLVISPGSSIAKRVQLESKTDYCGNLIYKNDVLDKILTPEGYIDKNENGIFVYHYYLKDHLGNNRVVIDQNGTTEQVNHYYPFGALFGESFGGAKQAYKYNGKELERMGGLDMYDYGARSHDPILGRFTTIDPLAEKYYSISPYAYCANNPISNIDPKGEWILNVVGAVVSGMIDYGSQVAGNMVSGKSFTESLTHDISIGSIIVSIGEGAVNPIGGVTKNIVKTTAKSAIKTIAKSSLKDGVTSAAGQVLDNTIKGNDLTKDVVTTTAVGMLAGNLKAKPVNNNAKKTISNANKKINAGKSLTHKKEKAFESAKSELKANIGLEATTNAISSTSQNIVEKKIKK